MTVETFVVARNTHEQKRGENKERTSHADKRPRCFIGPEKKFVQPRLHRSKTDQGHISILGRNMFRPQLLYSAAKHRGNGGK